MKAFSITLVVEFVTGIIFWRELERHDYDGNFYLGLYFWLMVVVYIVVDLMWAIFLVWLHYAR